MKAFPRITTDPSILGGRPTIRGTRMSVALIQNLFDHGMSFEEIRHEYPFLEEEDLREAARPTSRRAAPSKPRGRAS